MKQQPPVCLIFTMMMSVLMCALLAGCHRNPLMDESVIRTIKEDFFLNSPESFPIQKCAAYYSGRHRAAALKSTCEKWSAEYYRRLINEGAIPSTATLEDLRDPDFWKRVRPFD